MKHRSAPLAASLTMALVMGAGLAPPVGPAAAQEGSGATAARVLELEDEIRRLNGRIEQLEFRLRQVVEDATRRIGDLDYRMTVLEGGDASLLGDPAPLGQGGGGPASDSTGPVAAISERAALEDGIAALEAGDTTRARRILEDFMSAYPDGPLLGEAEYWLGETWYREGAYRRAATTFLTNVTDRADHPKTAASFLHLGLSLERLGHTGEACQTFREVLRRNPEAAVAEQAEAERQRLACP